MLNPDKVESHMRILSMYLAIPDIEDEDFTRRDQRKVSGTCEWLIEKDNFIRWRDGPPEGNGRNIYWLIGNPGCESK